MGYLDLPVPLSPMTKNLSDASTLLSICICVILCPEAALNMKATFNPHNHTEKWSIVSQRVRRRFRLLFRISYEIWLWTLNAGTQATAVSPADVARAKQRWWHAPGPSGLHSMHNILLGERFVFLAASTWPMLHFSSEALFTKVVSLLLPAKQHHRTFQHMYPE